MASALEKWSKFSKLRWPVWQPWFQLCVLLAGCRTDVNDA